jgi:hypothetical protein
MKLRHLLAALCALLSFLPALPTLAAASPTAVNVRIEGASETLFEGPLAVEPHDVLASSDTNPTPRPCDGINALDPENVVPAPTPTSASADAMALIGETFDGKWYPGFDDYFITRFGPDREAGGKSWGILVNDTFTSVGGCQYQLDEGDEVLWIYDAFGGRPDLALFPESEAAGGRPLTATATLNQPFGVEVVAFEDSQEDTPSEHPGREGSTLFPHADVSPVTTNAKGFERVDTADPATVVTDAEGKAQITFTTAGWHRIKATVPGAAQEEAIRSNRLDVCVPAMGRSDCGALPAEDQVRVPPSTGGEEGGPGSGEAGGGPGDGDGGSGGSGGSPSSGSGGDSPGGGSSPTGSGSSQPSGTAPQPGPLRVSVPSLDRAKLRQGRLGVSWKVLEAGAGVRRWTISSQALGAKPAPYVKRASGTTATSASVRLPPGDAYRLRFTITDTLGRTSMMTLGKVVIPGGRRG